MAEPNLARLLCDQPLERGGGDAPAADGLGLVSHAAVWGGAHKGVAPGHGAEQKPFDSYGSKVLGLPPQARVFTTSSLASAFGLGMGMLLPLIGGATACLVPTRP